MNVWLTGNVSLTGRSGHRTQWPGSPRGRTNGPGRDYWLTELSRGAGNWYIADEMIAVMALRGAMQCTLPGSGSNSG